MSEDIYETAYVGKGLKIKGLEKLDIKKSVKKTITKQKAPSPTHLDQAAIVTNTKTEAEKAFDLVKQKRKEERLKKNLEKTHREKMSSLNKKLENLSERTSMIVLHYFILSDFDIPRIAS
jgi:hypothetical protein